MTDNYDIDERPCPKCGGETRTAECGCDDGYVEDDDDCGQVEMVTCPYCHGYGNLWWCPKCGDCER